MIEKKKYNDTKQSYEKLGGRYLQSIRDLTPSDFYNFIKIIPRSALVLDVGCAGGRDSRNFLDNGFRVVGIDVVEGFIEASQRLYPEGKFYKMSVLDINFPEEQFDAIWANAVLLHLDDEDLVKALDNLRKVLKTKGTAFLSFKLGKEEATVIDKLSDGEARYFNFTNESKIIKLLEKFFKIDSYNIADDDANRDDVKWIRLFLTKV